MSIKWTYIVLLLTVTFNVMGQRGMVNESPEQDGGAKAPQVAPKDRLRSWSLVDDFTRVDSLAIDTMTAAVQQYDRIYKNSFSNITLGNIGSAYTSNLLSYQNQFNEFIFLNSLYDYFIQPEDIRFYNSKVPYTNLTYVYASPKRRSEENVSVFFTQNINKSLNIGFRYNLLSSVGLYAAQQTDNRNFSFFMSYNGPKYSMHGAVIYNKVLHYENGGLDNDDHEVILDDQKYAEFDQVENIPVKYTDQTNFVENYQFFLTQSLGIGQIKLHHNSPAVPADSSLLTEEGTYDEELQLPVSTAFHTLHISSYKRVFKIDELSKYLTKDEEDVFSVPLYGNRFFDPSRTGDTTRYTNVKNSFQLKFNEEANSLLRFGLRAFITNEVKHYKFQVEPDFETIDDVITPIYRSGDITFVSTHIGGQIFKNIGENFWWNLGGKLYVQGYKAGDIQVEGKVNSLYKVFKDTAGVYARGKIDLRKPEFLQESYYSNHFNWNNTSFRQEKIVNVEAGLNIPTRDLRLAFESKSLTDYIYWKFDGPYQTSDLINAFQVSLYKKFKFGPLHSDNKLAYQYTSNKDLYPLPDFAGLSSNYFDFYLAKRVLNVQIGVDVKYHTEYYTPAYMPATGQFYLQDKMKIGNYPFVDAFMNLQLKRARIFLKFDHVNQNLMERNYFLTMGYPYSPIRFKWGVSWNFYD